jgi:hypothetical protein
MRHVPKGALASAKLGFEGRKGPSGAQAFSMKKPDSISIALSQDTFFNDQGARGLEIMAEL